MKFYVVGRRWWTRIVPSLTPLHFHLDGMPMLVRR